MVNILFGTLILAFLLAFCVHVLVDVWQECRLQTAEAEHEELLDRLWFDGDPSAETLEAVSTIASAE